MQEIPFELNLDGFSFSNYRTGEKLILNPQLEKQGYRIIQDWFTSDGDSFGPLVRSCIVEKDGIKYTASYG